LIQSTTRTWPALDDRNLVSPPGCDNILLYDMACAWNGQIMDLLRALTTFVRVAESGSFSAVARENGSSHTAATRMVGQLEEHFGVRLFHRSTRRISLTEDGQDLLGHARNLLDAAEGMEGALGRQRASPTGRVRLGTPLGAARLLVTRLPGLLERYPGLSVDLVVRDQLGDLVEERLDVALQFGQPTDGSVVARAVATIGQMAIAAPVYLERHGMPSHPDELAQHACVIHDTGPNSTRWVFSGPQGPIEVPVSGRFHSNSLDVVRAAAVAGLGIALMPEPLIAEDLRMVRLYRLLADFPSGRQQAYVVYPSRRHLAPRTRVVIDFLAEEVRQVEARLAAGRTWGETDTAWLV
jgi:DNA-binding transcriptional LysR family regulator